MKQLNLIQEFTARDREATEYGFAWTDAQMVLDWIKSECDEVTQAIHDGEGDERIQEELGDLLSCVMSLILYCDFDIEDTLYKNQNKFNKRFQKLINITQENGLDDLKGLDKVSILKLWKQAKEIP